MAKVTQPLAKPDEAPHDSSSRPTLVSEATPKSTDDSGQGLTLFVLFTVAVLLVTSAVGFLALLTSWWVLGVVFGVHVLVTVIVSTAVFSALSSGRPSLEDDNPVQLRLTTSLERPVHSQARPSQTSPVAA